LPAGVIPTSSIVGLDRDFPGTFHQTNLALRLLFPSVEILMVAGSSPFASLLAGLVIRAVGLALLGPALLIAANFILR
jgi:hypothetical protein